MKNFRRQPRIQNDRHGFLPHARRRRGPGRLVVPALLLLFSSGVARGASGPLPVSPGSDVPTRTSDRCPTFSWSAVEEAKRYELTVYEITEEGEPRKLFVRRIPGAALSWTPSESRCLRPGASYGWSVRAETEDGPTPWAPPALFDLRTTGTETQSEASVDVPHRSLATRGDGEGDRAERPRSIERPVRSAAPGSATAASLTPPASTARLTVKGEIRSVDGNGNIRLWGRGRDGTEVYGETAGTACSIGFTAYGLSKTVVDWGSAAQACPQGSWVCTTSDLGGGSADICDTNRPDASSSDATNGIDYDYLACDGTFRSLPADLHHGWVNDARPSGPEGYAVQESTTAPGLTLFGRLTCQSLPVWCCWPKLTIAP